MAQSTNLLSSGSTVSSVVAFAPCLYLLLRRVEFVYSLLQTAITKIYQYPAQVLQFRPPFPLF
ncbi:MAG: hypothetical protein EPGJADBJ_02283 [Saprospiraceae bacterium]|nr:hypothetical protein [Saprospiraceae bacterium]